MAAFVHVFVHVECKFSDVFPSALFHWCIILAFYHWCVGEWCAVNERASHAGYKNLILLSSLTTHMYLNDQKCSSKRIYNCKEEEI